MMNPIRPSHKISFYVPPSERLILWLVVCVLILGVSLGVNAGNARGSTLPVGAAAGDPPVQLNYQGQLTDPQGVPLAGQIVSLKFRIYQQETGGVYDWSETHASVYTDADGRFNVLLNSTGQASGDLGNLLKNNGELWLEVEVDNETLAPRQKITSVGYALTSPWAGLTGMPLDFADGQDNLGLAGEGLSLSNGIFSLEGPYRLPQTCMYGQVAKWDNNTGAWVCAEDEQAGYTAGSGLLLTDSTISVNYGGNGSAVTVSRSDHTHTGQTWTATAPTGLQVTNSSGVSQARTLYGKTTGSSNTYGVVGETTSTSLGSKGVYGYASADSGHVYGVYGQADSPEGYGVFSQGNSYVQGDAIVDGDLMVNGSITFTVPVTRYVSIPPAAFIPVVSGRAYDAQFYLVNKEPGIKNSQKSFIAPLLLPDGATIISLREFVYNVAGGPWENNNTNLDVRTLIKRIDLYGGSVYILAMVQMSGYVPCPSYANFATTAITSPQVDNSRYSYYVEVSLPGADLEMDLVSALVEYTVSGP